MVSINFALLAAIGVALGAAMPQSSTSQGGPSVGDAANQCGNGQVISCCNSQSSSAGGVGGILNGLLGGNCSPIPVNVIGVQVPIQQACGNNQAACCSGSQDGLLNVQCVPVGL